MGDEKKLTTSELTELIQFGIKTEIGQVGSGEIIHRHSLSFGELWGHLLANGADPNRQIKWFAGEKSNPLAQAAQEAGLDPGLFYIETGGQIEAGCIIFPAAESGQDSLENMADSNGKIHMHPECTEHFIVLEGEIELLVDVESAIRMVDITDPRERYQVTNGMILTISPEVTEVPGVKYGTGVAMFSVTSNSYHHVQYVAPGTKLLLVKTPSVSVDEKSDWTRTIAHDCEFT